MGTLCQTGFGTGSPIPFVINLSVSLGGNGSLLYNDKISTGDEAAESLNNLRLSMQKIGYEVVVDRGDFKG